MKLPKEIWVRWKEYEKDAPSLDAVDRPSDVRFLVDLGEEAEVGVYRLEKVLSVQHQTLIQEKKPKGKGGEK